MALSWSQTRNARSWELHKMTRKKWSVAEKKRIGKQMSEWRHFLGAIGQIQRSSQQQRWNHQEKARACIELASAYSRISSRVGHKWTNWSCHKSMIEVIVAEWFQQSRVEFKMGSELGVEYQRDGIKWGYLAHVCGDARIAWELARAIECAIGSSASSALTSIVGKTCVGQQLADKLPRLHRVDTQYQINKLE